MNVLVLNSGSSSLKYQLIDMKTEETKAIGICDRVGSSESYIQHEVRNSRQSIPKYLPTHLEAVQAVIDVLRSSEHGAIKDLSEIHAIGQRVVHGGKYYSNSTIINDEVISRIVECCKIAPLHNPAALASIDACSKLMPNRIQVAVFDTSFHQTVPPKAHVYAIPIEYYEKFKIRRYGFHGTSHRFVSLRAAEILDEQISNLRLISCHLGNGCTVAAINRGESVDVSSGFTPLEGLMMGTRCGSIDPAVVTFLITDLGMTAQQANDVLNKKSGVLGISELSNDLRDVSAAADNGDKKAQLVYEMYAHTAKKTIGAYAFEMGGVDAIIFTAGIGENDCKMRKMILEGLESFGIQLDLELNAQRGNERVISSEPSQVKVLVIPTNEELMIARDTKELFEKLKEDQS